MYALAVVNKTTKISETQTGSYEMINQAFWNEVEAAKRLGWFLLGVVANEFDLAKIRQTWVNTDGQTVVIAMGRLEE